MIKRSIITFPDQRLRDISMPVESVDAEILTLIEDMFEAMYDANGIGLAAIQVAVPKRVIVVDTKRTGYMPAPMFLINPEIVWASNELNTYLEGCLSIPYYYENVKRPARVRVRHLDMAGSVHEFDADGLLATVVQHEIDHLNGGMFIDHLSRLRRERFRKKMIKL